MKDFQIERRELCILCQMVIACLFPIEIVQQNRIIAGIPIMLPFFRLFVVYNLYNSLNYDCVLRHYHQLRRFLEIHSFNTLTT
jgi:hypothetical protein